MYTIQKNLNRLNNYQPTFFLDPKEQKLLQGKLKKKDYKIYLPYPDSEKVIFYTDNIPDVLLYEIKSKQNISHQDILGSLFALNISKEMFGDIVISDGRYYVYIFPLLQNYFESNFRKVRNSAVEVSLVDKKCLQDFRRSYEEGQVIVSSERIDTVIAAIIHTSRTLIKEKIKDKEIMINHDILKEVSYVLKEGDVFSIRKFGKYKYGGIIKQTKKDNYILQYFKYL